ncbi:DUF2787 family protein [Vibrio splendidus]|uniref:DUF2787 family protein n=1 Tax=Vibrio splendidus TaxID=29497 RepID=UPI000C837DDF|nr:DUF2787 family protein [Vibrio splendidus]PMH09475.1 hypothetical protein BCU75_14180 [Vibrio splendidus]PMI83961.1 hypothetical protein BCU37_13045 [Vibrio splendidus]PMK17588.1 hypothetical protein BCU10_11610 [Vibrio splendidus]PMK54745.1 hypothetical protein BCT96_22515 [Vibrio splendidus]
MKLCFSKNKLTLPVSVDLQDTLNRVITDSGKWTPMIQSVVINFRGKSYCPENGGYHPVEIRISRLNDQWVFDYITDFSYCGLMPELEKEIDFDFGHGVAYIRYMGEVPITESSVAEFYSMWETNFLSYIGMDCFDEIKVTVD